MNNNVQFNISIWSIGIVVENIFETRENVSVGVSSAFRPCANNPNRRLRGGEDGSVGCTQGWPTMAAGCTRGGHCTRTHRSDDAIAARTCLTPPTLEKPPYHPLCRETRPVFPAVRALAAFLLGNATIIFIIVQYWKRCNVCLESDKNYFFHNKKKWYDSEGMILRLPKQKRS